MHINHTYSLFFSATFTTQTTMRSIAEGLGLETKENNLLDHPLDNDVCLAADDLLIAGMPVYAGRIPPIAADSLRHYKGSGTPAIIAAVYGNRHYDDALLEIADILSENGFQMIAAGAFIAEHCIFPKVAAGRPNADDLAFARRFGETCRRILDSAESTTAIPAVSIPGKRPYKIPGNIPICPSGNKDCAGCGECAAECPVNAIDPENPKNTNTGRCIRCGRCIAICPTHARGYHSITYKIAGLKFVSDNKKPRQPEIWLPAGIQ